MTGSAYGYVNMDGTYGPQGESNYGRAQRLAAEAALAYDYTLKGGFGSGTNLRGSVRTDDKPGKRARVDGDHALINTLRTKPTRVSLGPSLSFNNTSFLQEMLNRKTSVTVCGGYHFFAEEGKRAFHLQHYRHSAFAPNPSRS